MIPDTPAEAAGLQAEDIIVEVDGTSTKGMTTTDVVALIKGEENTDVTLTVYRKGETDYLDITVTRKKVEAPTVSYKMLDSNIAYIQIAQFEDVTLVSVPPGLLRRSRINAFMPSSLAFAICSVNWSPVTSSNCAI